MKFSATIYSPQKKNSGASASLSSPGMNSLYSPEFKASASLSPTRGSATSPSRFSSSSPLPFETMTIGGSPSNNHIPFTQRQSKSKVAAREILKKGESVRNSFLYCFSVL
jgi:hypothetical protein